MTPTDALAMALADGNPRHKPWVGLAADKLLAALPEGAAVVTVDSLAAALRTHAAIVKPSDALGGVHRCSSHCAAAIIQAAQEAERV